MSNINWNFSTKNVLIVGDSRGIGKNLRDNFKKYGAQVQGINSSICDIENVSEIALFFSSKLKFKSIDILVNVAGINFTHSLSQISVGEWDKVLNINLRSFFYIIQNTIKIMPEGSKIINVSSIAGRNKSIVSGVHYTSSKAGIIGLTKQIAHELGSKRINVNCVCPSQTKTEMLMASMTKSEIIDLGKSIPLGRIAEPQEVVNAILFLSTEESSYITGTTLDVNGGQL